MLALYDPSQTDSFLCLKATPQREKLLAFLLDGLPRVHRGWSSAWRTARGEEQQYCLGLGRKAQCRLLLQLL